jgi:hypothetical protein
LDRRAACDEPKAKQLDRRSGTMNMDKTTKKSEKCETKIIGKTRENERAKYNNNKSKRNVNRLDGLSGGS